MLRLLRSTADGGGSEESCRDVFVHGLGPAITRRFVNEALCAVWNSCAAARLSRHGHRRVLEGDIVRPRPPPDALGHFIGRGDHGNVPPPPALADPASLAPVFVTADDVAARRYSIHDVVLPIPGAGVVLPRNECARHALKSLEAHGIHLHPEHHVWPHFVAGGNPLGLDVIGGYRYVLERPLNLRCDFGGDEDDAEAAAVRRELRNLGAKWARKQNTKCTLRFDLPASAYSWSLLREVARSDAFAEENVERRQVDTEGERGQVDRDRPTRFRSAAERTAYEQMKKPRDHFGTDLMALAKIEASVFARGSTDGSGPLAPPSAVAGRRDAFSRMGYGRL